MIEMVDVTGFVLSELVELNYLPYLD